MQIDYVHVSLLNFTYCFLIIFVNMIRIILTVIIVCDCGEFSKTPLENIFEKAEKDITGDADGEINVEKLNTNILETYPILVPSNLAIQICLKDTSLRDQLHVNLNDCDNYPCMFSKVIEDESMESIVTILRNDTMDTISRQFKQSIHDCTIWWKLFKHFNENANPRWELGRCLFQAFSSKCRDSVLDKIKPLLVTMEEK